MTRADLEAAVTAALNDLGDTPAAIAVTLAARGITGVPQDCGACPIAKAIEAALPGAVVLVGGYTLGVRVGSVFVEVDMPDAFSEFVEAFDKGRYPQLVDRAAVAS